jgi:outer membrane protein assembly factor BamB
VIVAVGMTALPDASGASANRHGVRMALRASSGRTLWSARFGGADESADLVGAGRGLVFGLGCASSERPRGPILVAFDQVNGKQRWRRTFRAPAHQGGALLGGPDTAAAGVVIFTTPGTVRALRFDSGAVRWRAEVVRALAAGPTFVYTVQRDPRSSNDDLVALDRSTGRSRWHVPLPGPVLLGAASEDTLVLVGQPRASTFVLDARTGAVRFAVTMGNSPSAELTSGVLVYDAPDPSRPLAVAVDALTGVQRWSGSYAVLGGMHGPEGVLYAYDDVAVVDGGPEVVKLRVSDGTVLWQQPHHEGGLFADGATDTTLMLANSSSLTALDASTGAQRWRRSTPDLHSAAVSRERVFATTGCPDPG